MAKTKRARTKRKAKRKASRVSRKKKVKKTVAVPKSAPVILEKKEKQSPHTMLSPTNFIPPNIGHAADPLLWNQAYQQLTALPAPYNQVQPLILPVNAEMDIMLHEAAKAGEVERLIKALKGGANVESKRKNWPKVTALYIASKLGHLRVVEELLLAGADPNTSLSKYSAVRPITEAAKNGFLKVVETLHKSGADLDWEEGEKPLPVACEFGHLKIAEYLVAAGAEVNMPQYGGSESPLMKASNKGHMKIFKLLVDAGADINYLAEYNHSALTSACGGGHIQIVELLLMSEKLDHTPRGAPPTICPIGFNLMNALDFATAYPEIQRLLVEQLQAIGADLTSYQRQRAATMFAPY